MHAERMPRIDDQRRLDRYRETIRCAWGQGDGNSWPIKLNAAFHLFLEPFGEELLEDLDWLEGRGKSLAEIAAPFYNPARLYRIIDSTIYGLRRKHLPLADQRRVVLKLLDMTRALKYGSELNENGCNEIYGPEALERVMSAKTWHTVESVEESMTVHRFCALMWAYTEAIFFRAHDVTKEIHGPYGVAGTDRRFIVKEYLNLRPRELWPTMPLLPCDTVKIFKQYVPEVRIRIDALNHLYQEGAPLVPSLERYAIEVDGEPRDLEVLQRFLARAQETVQAISHHIDGIDWNQRVLKYADIFWFRKKPLRDQRGVDWRVPSSVRAAILAGEENRRRRPQLSNEASARLAMLTI